MYGYVTQSAELAAVNPKDEKHIAEFKKYLIIRKSAKAKAGIRYTFAATQLTSN
ncbi:hypothetical protein FACS1894187_25010 [Synergistales bacterium]|nr:hypothetical protein FACS1894187_25010 [Synergistales bacterium]